MSFGPKHYVPVLKCKRGEKAAVALLERKVRRSLTPLFEIIEIKDKSLSGHLDTSFAKLEDAVGDEPFFLDAREVSDVSGGSRGVFDRAGSARLNFVPVTGPSRENEDQLAALAHRARGICLRVTVAELLEGSVAETIARFLANHDVKPADVDLLMDMGPVEDKIQSTVTTIAQDFLDSVADHGAWRTFTLSGCAFPKSMADVKSNDFGSAPRMEWLAWRALYDRASQLDRLPTFSDCGIQHSSGVEDFDPKIHHVSAAIRYARKKEWLLIKGSSTKKTPASRQFLRLANTLTSKEPPYCGIAHCRGCHGMKDCADGAPGFGSPEAWRRLGTIHHLTVVTQQLVQLHGP